MAQKTILTHDKTLVFGHILFDDKPTRDRRSGAGLEARLLRPPYNAPGTGALDIPRVTDWRNWRDVVYPLLEEMGFDIRKAAFS